MDDASAYASARYPIERAIEAKDGARTPPAPVKVTTWF
jgi:hypothetical protein